MYSSHAGEQRYIWYESTADISSSYSTIKKQEVRICRLLHKFSSKLQRVSFSNNRCNFYSRDIVLIKSISDDSDLQVTTRSVRTEPSQFRYTWPLFTTKNPELLVPIFLRTRSMISFFFRNDGIVIDNLVRSHVKERSFPWWGLVCPVSRL